MIRDGLGNVPPASSLIASGLTTSTGILSATGVTGSLLAAIGVGAQAVPIVGTIVGAIALTIGALGIGNGCGETCTASTTVVNQIEPYMQQNLAAAQAQAAQNGGCLTSDEVSTLEANFNQLWQYVVQNCQKVGGPGGSQCVADRQPGGKYDWTAYYLIPIQQIPVCSSASASGVASSLGISSSVILYGALAAIALFAFSD